MFRKFLPLVALLFLLACEKSDNAPKEGCDEAILAQLGYVRPEGEVDFSGPDCIGFLNKLRFADGEIYYMPDCNCCDMALRIYNCDGEDICDEDGLCPGFADSEVVEIVGVL